jgi:hypothetical protein
MIDIIPQTVGFGRSRRAHQPSLRIKKPAANGRRADIQSEDFQ